MNKGAGRVWHTGRLSNAVGCLDFLKCVYFLPFSLQSHRSVWSYRLLMFVCRPACSLSLLCQSASGGWSCAWKRINHPTIVHHHNDVRCYANIALQAIYISILKFGGVLPCPFAVPHISITHYTMKFSWTARVMWSNLHRVLLSYI